MQAGARGIDCLTASVGADSDAAAENRAVDVQALRSRLGELGYAVRVVEQDTAVLLPQQRKRLFFCAFADRARAEALAVPPVTSPFPPGVGPTPANR